MSFSSSLKNDICRMMKEQHECCVDAELTAIIRVNRPKFRKEEANITITTENAALARRVFLFSKKIFHIHPEIIMRRNKRLKKHNVYILTLPQNDFFEEVTYWATARKPYRGELKKLLDKECCRKAYLRGAFLGGGAVSDPEKAYHLEIIARSKWIALEVADIMNGFGLNARITKHNRNHVVYLKDGERIVDFLNIIGAHTALMEVENIRILKEMRNNVNRIVNCETANLEKTINASLRQIEKIKRLKDHMGFERLPRGLKDIAELRIKYHDASLKELGEMLSPPIGKSGVNHRLRKLEEIADRIK